MLGKSLLLDSLSKGYIQQDEIDFIRSFMWDNEGSILEVGAYVGKTFHGLFKHRPDWDYTAVDTWELYPFPMVDPKLPFDHTLDYPMVHSKYFKEITFNQITRGCLIFWDGHVAITINETNIIHANAYHMKVQVEKLSHAINRLGNPVSVKIFKKTM